MILCLCIIGAQLPTWMFINSLSLIVHTTLLHSLMPPGVFYVFKQYLYLVRMTWPGAVENVDETYNASDYANEEGWYNIYLKSSDYFHLFAHNMFVIIMTGVAIVIVWAVFWLIDRVKCFYQPSLQMLFGISITNKEPMANNFALRFFYELFLEFCICALVNIAYVGAPEEGTVNIQWFMSLVIILGITAYVAWLISLFFFNGPILQGFYHKLGLVGWLWNERTFATDFNAVEKAKQKRKAERKARRKQLKELARLRA